MSKSNTTENDLAKYIFNATAIPWDSAANLYVSLHTADPGEGGDQTTSEATYTSYARVAVTRDSGGFTVSGNSAQNTALIQFPQATGGSSVCTHLAIGTASSGTGQILYSGALSSSLTVTNGIQPQFNAGTLVVSED